MLAKWLGFKPEVYKIHKKLSEPNPEGIRWYDVIGINVFVLICIGFIMIAIKWLNKL